MQSLNELLKELSDLGIVKIEDAITTSKEMMSSYEKKYNISSKSFYALYLQGVQNDILESMTSYDIIDWAYYCKCYINAGGSLQSFSSKDTKEKRDYCKTNENILEQENTITYKKRGERSPLFLFWFAKNFMNFKIKQIFFKCWSSNNSGIARKSNYFSINKTIFISHNSCIYT